MLEEDSTIFCFPSASKNYGHLSAILETSRIDITALYFYNVSLMRGDSAASVESLTNATWVRQFKENRTNYRAFLHRTLPLLSQKSYSLKERQGRRSANGNYLQDWENITFYDSYDCGDSPSDIHPQRKHLHELTWGESEEINWWRSESKERYTTTEQSDQQRDRRTSALKSGVDLLEHYRRNLLRSMSWAKPCEITRAALFRRISIVVDRSENHIELAVDLTCKV